MNKHLLDKAVQAYLHLNLQADANQIALSKSAFKEVSSAELAGQITAKKKAEKKLPTWFHTENIYYPSPLSIEQTSSEITAKYKAKLALGDSLIDVTGGFGVDAYYFSKRIKEVTHCEINISLSDIAQHNAQELKTTNIHFLAEDGIAFIRNHSKKFDTVYIDPARRAEKGKVFMLKDCSPDVVSNLAALQEKSTRIIIKTAPLLDLAAGLSELKNVSEIHIVSTKNECKELLWVIDKGFIGSPKIVAAMLNDHEKDFSFIFSDKEATVEFCHSILPGEYLYEPDVALLKAGNFNLIAERYTLKKLHPQTQLYCSREFNTDFPGRIFEVKNIISTSDFKKEKNLSGNVIVRNYPGKPEDLIKKYKIKPAKEQFFLFTKLYDGNNCIIEAAIKQYY
ncbi:hypothetical protein [Pedobacter sp. MW01-1-1]|uniref:hypothetical protein n=1 Tax=Pedobacter sp. MW01-1-1 TaxID=3383027 RepID=UPI003FEF1F3A